MQYVLQRQTYLGGLIAHEWLGVGRIVTEPASNHFAADHHLIVAQVLALSGERIVLGIGGQDVDQFDDPIRS